MLWIIFACLTAAVLLAMLRPMFGAAAPEDVQDAKDVQVYRDQLDEIEADEARGLIGKDEAKAARLEVQRRLLAVSEADAKGAVAAQTPRWAIFAIGLCLPAIAIGLYAYYGSPKLPDQPLQARLNEPLDQNNIPELIARVEALLRQKPNDGRGWEVIAPVYMGVGNFDDAAEAYRKSIELLGGTAARYAGLGEALMLGNDGVATGPARAALNKAIELDPAPLRPHILLALAAEEDGDYSDAVARWKAIKTRADASSRWAKLADQKIAEDEARLAGKPVPQAPAMGGVAGPGPDQADVAAAQTMGPEARQSMIEGMVARLASKLEAQGDDLDGWLKLVRAYAVLNKPADAENALAKARSQFGDNPAALSRLDALENELGLNSKG
ncbi:c-type cytochrome biogenesis protein CcmI [Methyloligella sp. 2.7D]|uniref:c-type cytochrome biogenesis protein CcmI n=1 Tax=unclassified Methyloligella TaxID=2625955 RepID=UPI00157BC684|nr:c-type cytochrome biogenesis protein CcmI [Methyloligella sp. GL2]QKP77131.1 c-type cytochrome biogenesis protein CcmI [Methyloligella sp. GL2]